jgi:cell division protein ZapA
LNLAFESPEAAPSTTVATAAVSDIPQESQHRLSQLLKRLDQVLEQDGQLI